MYLSQSNIVRSRDVTLCRRMATLEDKILGEKLHYYCSSSEGEDSDSDASNQDDGFDVEKSKQAQADRISEKVMNDVSAN